MNTGVYDTILGNLISLGIVLAIGWGVLLLRDFVDYIDGDDPGPPQID